MLRRLFAPMWVACACSVVSSACRSKDSARREESPPAVSSKPAAVKPPELLPRDQVDSVLNPKNLPPYSGPQGIVKGVVRAKGPTAPTLKDKIDEIPVEKCDRAEAMYGKLFREGPERALADVLVAVTEYAGYVPPKDPVVPLDIRGCAFGTRTLALAFGQRLEVRSHDREGALPQLVGQKSPGLLVAIPGGDPVPITPLRVGHYELQDQSHPFATADVFVLKYSTTDVTGLDGKFEIRGVPAGEVRVSAYLPAVGRTVAQKVTLKDGQTVELDLTILVEPQPMPQGSASGGGAAPPPL